MSNERLHHPYSPSKLQYLEASPHWTGEESKNTEASLAGTAQHDAAEDHVNIDDPALNDRQAEAVAMCKAYRDGIIAKYPGGTIQKEVYLPIDDEVIVDEAGNPFCGTTGGYLDFAILSADRRTAEIIDWKFGLWSVEPAENNLQGIAYLLGLVKQNPEIEQVTVHFCMPHRDEITLHTFKREQFPALLLRVKTVVARAIEARRSKDTSTCTATVSSCLFCGNKGKCAALAKFALKVANKYAPAKVPDHVTPSLLTDPTKSKQSMEIAQLLEAWGKAIRAQITARVIEDEEWMPEGYTFRSRANNELKDLKKLLKMARAAGVSKAAIREALSAHLTPIYTALRALHPRGSKDKAEDEFRQKLLAEGALEAKPPTYFLERLKT